MAVNRITNNQTLNKESINRGEEKSTKNLSQRGNDRRTVTPGKDFNKGYGHMPYIKTYHAHDSRFRREGARGTSGTGTNPSDLLRQQLDDLPGLEDIEDLY